MGFDGICINDTLLVYLCCIPPKNGYIADFPPRKAEYIVGFPLFIARLPPRKAYCIVDFPPFFHPGQTIGGSFVVKLRNIRGDFYVHNDG